MTATENIQETNMLDNKIENLISIRIVVSALLEKNMAILMSTTLNKIPFFKYYYTFWQLISINDTVWA